ncbi:MAG: TrmH family RNA methyltransferase [Erysipelotrichaceae bacterium]
MTKLTIIGSISVKSALLNHKRDVFEVFFAKEKLINDRNLKYIDKVAKSQEIKINYLSKIELTNRFGVGHGGVCAIVSNYDYGYEDFSDIVYLLDGVEDPYNFGHSLRSLYASGVTQLIIPRALMIEQEPIILRSSAGALDKIDLIIKDEANELLDYFLENDYQVVALDRKNAISLFDFEFGDKLLIVVGGEKRGISKQVLSKCHSSIYIPYGSDFKNALTSTSAISVLAFEIFRRNI